MGIVGSGHNRICICEIHGQLISINGFFGERIDPTKSRINVYLFHIDSMIC